MKLFYKIILVLFFIGISFVSTSQNLRDFDWVNYTGFVAVYKQPACTKCFTELADYFDSLNSNEKLEYACVAPMNSVFRRSTMKFVCELTHSFPENINFISQLIDIGVEGEEDLLFPHLLYFESGKVIKQFQYKVIFTSTNLNTTAIEKFIKELHQ